MATTRPANARRQHPQSGTELDTTWKKEPGRPKMTWRQTVMAELREMGLSWGEAQASAKDMTLWQKLLWPYVPLGTKRISKYGSLDTGEIDDVPDPLVQTALREVSVFSHMTQDLDVKLILQCVHFDAKCTLFDCRSKILCDVRHVEYTYVVVTVQVNHHNMLAYYYISDGVSGNSWTDTFNRKVFMGI